ncbi:MAG: hypothetical protein ACRC3B_22985, partial [Bacteroidia bacterium]
ENKPDRDLRNDPVKENADDKKRGTNEKNEKVKTEPGADEKKASENYKKHEDEVSDTDKKKLKEDADKDVGDGPDSDSKRRALFMAKVITEANDAADVPVDATLAELMPLTLMKGVRGFGKQESSVPGADKIVMYGSEHTVDESYTDGEEEQDRDNVNNRNSAQYENREANVEEVENWQQLERGIQDDSKVTRMVDELNQMQDGTPDWVNFWLTPKEVVTVVICNGKIILRNGHHRITAAIKSGYKGTIPYKVLPLDEVVGPGKQFNTLQDLLDAAQ